MDKQVFKDWDELDLRFNFLQWVIYYWYKIVLRKRVDAFFGYHPMVLKLRK